MAKEALFNILHNQYGIEGADILDLFSGTGSLSYEFYSRECNHITSVDKNNKCIRFIRDTKEKLQMDSLEVIQADSFSFLKSTWKKYDIIFADPPYSMPDFEKIVELVFNRELLNTDGILIIEHSRDTNLSHFANHTNTRNYGSVHFSFFEA
jgi:16S rRNA (guanine(966)-N(2))-methyltransferase RsmD